MGKGFSFLSPERRREIASMGGKAAHIKKTAHRFTAEEARRAGQIGGMKVSQNRQHMSEIGMKGGKKTASRQRTVNVD
jgi:general stress protein YciG